MKQPEEERTPSGKETWKETRMFTAPSIGHIYECQFTGI